MGFFRTLLSTLGLTRSEPPRTRSDGDKAEWVDAVTNNYAGVAAGVAINRKCRILSPREGDKLERDLELFTSALEGKIHPEFMKLARKTSEDLAADHPYSECGADAREAVKEAQELVAWWLNELGERRD